MDVYDFSEDRKISLRRVLDFTDLANPLGPSGKAKTAMRRALKTVPLHPDEKVRYLRRHIAKSENLGEANILFANGSSRIYTLLMESLQITKAATIWPLHGPYKRLFGLRGIQTEMVPANSEQCFLPDLEALMSSGSGAHLLLVPNPHPVTGGLLSPEALDRVIHSLKGTDAIVAIDESLSQFARSESPARQMIESPHCIIIRSFSFFHALAGLRLGYALGHLDLLKKMGSHLEPGPINALAAQAALASLKDKGYRERTLHFIQGEKTYLKGRLARIGGVSVMDTPCNFLLIRVPPDLSDLPSLFSKRNVLIKQFTDEKGRVWLQAPIRRRRENASFVKILAGLLRGPVAKMRSMPV